MIEQLFRRIPDAASTDEQLLVDLLAAAGDTICAYTGRAEVPEALANVQVSLAVIMFNRMGMEGESAHSEGGVSRTAQMLPDDLRHQLNPFRLVKAVGL